MRIFASLNQLPATAPRRVGYPVSGDLFRLFGQVTVTVVAIIALLAIPGEVRAAPGDILFQDNFERSNPGTVGNGWTVTAAAGACTGAAPTVVPAVFPTATLTIAGSQKVPVNGITVGGQQIMAAGYAGNTSPGTVATNIRNQINACTAAITGNCTVAGYSATRSGSVVTITGPSTATGTLVVALGTPSGTGTAETFTATAFTAYTPATSTGGNTGCAGIDADTPPWNGTTLPLAPHANDNSRTMFTRWATVTVDSPVIDLAGKAAAQITFWVRRGSDCYSEWPGNNGAGCNATLTPFNTLLGEEFQTQYKNSAGTWLVLSQYPTDGTPGEIFRPVIDLPADALWSGFQLRFRQPGGSGFGGSAGAPNVLGYDYWHLDDVKVTELAATSYVGAFCDTFEGDLSRWYFIGTGNAAIGSRYFQNGVHDLDIRWGAVAVTTKPTDISGATGNIQYWIKRGVGNVTQIPNSTGSDIPEGGENLVVEYLTTTAGVWAPLVPTTTFVGGGAGGQVWCPTVGTNCATATPATTNIPFPANANLAAFQLRFRSLGGSGADQDYWHVDDVCLGTVITGTDLSLTMVPSNTTTSLAPGATSTITFTVTNIGPNVEPGAITITDTLPVGLSYVPNSSSPGWSSGTWPPGLTDCSTVGQVLSCTRVGSLAVGASTTLTITVQADANATGTVTNSPTVGGQSLETVPANNTATNNYSFTPSAFEAYETSTTAGATTGRIYTKIAGTSFNLKVIAKNAAGTAINTTYNKAPTVDLINGTLACVAGTAALAGVTVTPSPYTYVAGDSGAHIYAFNSNYAYPNVKVRIRDNTPAVGCSSDNFAIRPGAFTITSTDATNNNSTGASIIAGTAFTLNAASVAGYNGTPIIDNSAGKVIGSPTAGTLGGGFSAAAVATGTATGANFSYSEVGNFGLSANAVYDSTFTLVDQSANDCVATEGLSFANTTDANGQYGCSIGSIGVAQTTGSSGFGRFIPDHFDTVITLTPTEPLPCPTGLTCPCPGGLICPPATSNGFVYSGQPFTVQVIARNLAGGITSNYANAYASTVTLGAWDALGSTVTNNPSAGTLGVTTANTFTAGVSTTANQQYVIATATAPTNIFLRAEESAGDAVTSLSATAASSIEGGVMVVSGRIRIVNAHGSELLPLPITATVQYFGGVSWLTSSTDNLTQFNSNLSAVGNVVANVVSGLPAGVAVLNPGIAAFVAGARTVQLAAPGVAGSVSINLDAPSYLPSNLARATFGVYKGANEFIYLRENY